MENQHYKKNYIQAVKRTKWFGILLLKILILKAGGEGGKEIYKI